MEEARKYKIDEVLYFVIYVDVEYYGDRKAQQLYEGLRDNLLKNREDNLDYLEKIIILPGAVGQTKVEMLSGSLSTPEQLELLAKKHEEFIARFDDIIKKLDSTDETIPDSQV